MGKMAIFNIKMQKNLANGQYSHQFNRKSHIIDFCAMEAMHCCCELTFAL